MCSGERFVFLLNRQSSENTRLKSSSLSCSILCDRVGGNDPPFGSALDISHRHYINEASPFKHIDSPCCPRTASKFVPPAIEIAWFISQRGIKLDELLAECDNSHESITFQHYSL